MIDFFYKRKKLIFVMLITVILFFLSITLFLLRSRYDDNINEVLFSKKSGFYDKPFYLEMSAEYNDLTIYYTLDGSEPTEKSLKYEEPILIENATKNPNTNSLNTDVTILFKKDLIEKYYDKGILNYSIPDYLIDKCTVVRAVAIDNDGNRSEETKESFFVGIDSKKYNECNIISLIINPEYLFGDDGIYVLGKSFDDFMKKNDFSGSWPYWDANYRQHGKEWERKGYINVFDSNGNNVLNKDIGIRVRGYMSRALVPKSLNLYSIDENGDRDYFNYDFFKNGFNAKRLTLAAGGNQFLNQFSDYMINSRVADLNISTVHSEPYILFIDGEYWGFYWLNEKFDNNYFAKYYGVDANDVVMIKNGKIEIGDEEDYEYYREMNHFIIDYDMSIESNYQKACEMIDIDSYIDYYSLMIYISRSVDWPSGNYALWRTKTKATSGYNDGKWRWIVFDCNSACMQDRDYIIDKDEYKKNVNLVSLDSIEYLLNVDNRFASLWKNDGFRQKLLDGVEHVATTYFDSKEMNEFIDNYIDKIEPIMSESWKRFFGSHNYIRMMFDSDMKSFRNFFNKRKDTIDDILSRYR